MIHLKLSLVFKMTIILDFVIYMTKLQISDRIRYLLPSSVTTRKYGRSYIDGVNEDLEEIQRLFKLVRLCRKIDSKVLHDRYCSLDNSIFYYLEIPVLNLITLAYDMKTVNACRAQMALKLRCMIDIAYAPPSPAQRLGGIMYQYAKKNYYETAAAAASCC